VICEEKIHFSDDSGAVYSYISWNRHRLCESLPNVIGYGSLQALKQAQASASSAAGKEKGQSSGTNSL